MGDCCGRADYDQAFGVDFARRRARRYADRGLTRPERRVADFCLARGVQGRTVLEVGGGVGELHVELLRQGATSATNLEISSSYEAEATDLLARTGTADRVTRRILDLAVAPDEVDEADVVLLHRVVCCYAESPALLVAAGRHARRLLVFSYPPRTLVSRAVVATDNLGHRLRRNPFRTFLHDPAVLVAAVESTGLVPAYRHHGVTWDVAGFVRP